MKKTLGELRSLEDKIATGEANTPKVIDSD